MTGRVQRYVITAEVILQDRGDYANLRRTIENFFKADRAGYQCDYVAIQSVPSDPIRRMKNDDPL